MIKLYFLEADQPLTKTFKQLPDGSLEKGSYPNVYEVTSYVEECADISAMVPLLVTHGGAGRCLLKGALARPLVSESRAGATVASTPSSWVCFDLDGVEMPDTDAFMQQIGLGDVSYVRQWSPSMGLSEKTKLRCHIFVFLNEETSPSYLKAWLMHLNLTVPMLKANLSLTSTGMALSWTLDVTTCQNDKLLYIAPPVLSSELKDPYPTDRYEYVPRAKLVAAMPTNLPTRQALRAAQDAMITELRDAARLPKRDKFVYKTEGGFEYLAKPDAAMVTGTKRERGFIYFNLNGGDSWAYYHPEKQPSFVYNFKGEPLYKTSELLPDYWADLKRQTNTGKPSHDGVVYLAFREFKSSMYYNAKYDVAADDLEFAAARSIKQLSDFMLQHGQVMGEVVPDWEFVWAPTSSVVVDPENKTLNVFKPSQFMKKKPKPGVLQPPPLCDQIIDSVCGSDAETKAWFYNWFAYILQYRDRTGVAFVTSGEGSTGKGTLYDQIFAPLLGRDNVTQKRMEELEGQFNGFIARRLLCNIDEAEASAYGTKKVNAKIKNIITEPHVSIRELYQSAQDMENRCNFYFSSNKLDPVEAVSGDRRYTIAPYQKKSWMELKEKIHLIEGELEDLYSYLMGLQVDVLKAKTALDNSAKRSLVEVNRPTIDAVSEALTAGDMLFFVDMLPGDNLPNRIDMGRQQATIVREYCELIERLLATGETKLTRGEVYILCQYCVGRMPESPAKFTTLLRHHKLEMVHVWRDGRTQRGLVAPWTMDPAWVSQTLREHQTLFDNVKTL
jgi:hypothetical protein